MSNSNAKKSPAAATTAKNGWDNKSEAALTQAYEKAGKPSDSAELLKIGANFGGKTAAQIRGKLVSMGIYEKGEPKAVGGASATRKIEIVHAIETLLSQKKGSLASLEKASKPELDALAQALVSLSDQREANSAPTDSAE